MTRATFFKHFELLADQPDAVAKMRGLVLELAIRGQLVERNSKDEPAAKLLEKIKTEKREFLRASKLKEVEALPQISADEAPFTCPSAWEWVRLGSISNRIHYGYTASADHSQQDVRLLRITDIQDNQVNWKTVPGCQISAQEVAKYALHDNDILIARTGGTIGKTFLVTSVAVKAVFASYLIRVIPSSQISARYLKLFLESPCYWRQLLAKSAGTGQPNVNGEALSGLCISLPPLVEQRRIVAKVDELMALCDELEQRRQARQHASGLLQQSALHHLLAAREPQTFAAAWQRVRDHFHLLHDTPDAILQLAVQGRLVPQNPKDEPAEKLLGRLRARNCPRGMAEPDESNGNSKPFDLPPGWVWARFPELGKFSRGKSRHRPRNEPSLYNDGKYPLVQTGDVARAKGIIRTHTGLYNEKGLAQSKLWPPGTMCITIAANIAETGILGMEACIPDSVVGFIPDGGFGGAEYFEFFMRTAKSRLQDFAPSTAQKNINMGILESVYVPLPPLAEQKRIVVRVEELLRWCDTLEAQLHQTRTLGAHLLDPTLHHLLAA